jgi:hypothetical protein
MRRVHASACAEPSVRGGRRMRGTNRASIDSRGRRRTTSPTPSISAREADTCGVCEHVCGGA